MVTLFASCVPKKLLNLLAISMLSDVVDAESVMTETIELEGVLLKIKCIVVPSFF